MSPLPLDGIRVLDAGDFVAAPYCAMLLADWGADVIKVEPLTGDTSRSVGEVVAAPDLSAIFVSANRGKRSVALDLHRDDGRATLADLAAHCDIVIHNRTIDRARRIGLDHASLCARRPDAIVGSVTAFGDEGPYANRGALDLIPQAMSGMMSVTGPVDGQPTRCGVTVIDFGAGLTLAGGLMAALFARERTGTGAAITTSLLDIGLTFSSSLYPLASVLGHPPPRLNNRSHPLLADQFATRDGFIVLAVWDEARWATLCGLLETPELTAYTSNADRLAAYDEVQPALAQAIQRWPAAELVDQLVAAGIVCAQTYDVAQVQDDPHIQAIGALYTEDRLGGPPLTLARGPIRVDDATPRAAAPPPRLGQHTAEVLAELLGLSAN